MIISEKKNFERKIFKNLMEKSSSIERRNVEFNVKNLDMKPQRKICIVGQYMRSKILGKEPLIK